MEHSKGRLEAFSDGVIAIIITIMVLSIPLPNQFDWASMKELMITLVIYFISFIVVGSFWVRHHQILNFTKKISNQVIWANMMFLFFLSLIPYFTKWVIEHPSKIGPAIGYDITFLLVNFSYGLIFRYVIHNSKHHAIKKIMEEREKIEAEDMPRFSWLRLLITVGIFLGAIITLSIYLPRLSTALLIGLPVTFSAINLFLDDFIKRKKQTTEESGT